MTSDAVLQVWKLLVKESIAEPEDFSERGTPLTPELLRLIGKAFPHVSILENEEQKVMYDGKTHNIAAHKCKYLHEILHEIAHFSVCPEDRRSVDNYGLGGQTFAQQITERIVTWEEANQEECIGSMLGICWESFMGYDITNTLYYHNWAEQDEADVAEYLRLALPYLDSAKIDILASGVASKQNQNEVDMECHGAQSNPS